MPTEEKTLKGMKLHITLSNYNIPPLAVTAATSLSSRYNTLLVCSMIALESKKTQPFYYNVSAI